MIESPILPEAGAKDHTRLIGVTAAARAAVIEERIRHAEPQVWFVVATTASLIESLAEDLRLFNRASRKSKTELNCLILPELPEDTSRGPGNFEPASDRLATLSSLQNYRPGTAKLSLSSPPHGPSINPFRPQMRFGISDCLSRRAYRFRLRSVSKRSTDSTTMPSQSVRLPARWRSEAAFSMSIRSPATVPTGSISSETRSIRFRNLIQ